MKKSKAKRGFGIMLCTVLVAMLLPVTAKADMGPKPSIWITFEGLGDELCYGTLLSKTSSTGPSFAWDGIDANARHNGNEDFYYAELDYETWKAFAEYEDPDGYYFLQEGWQVDETEELAWTYYPPQSFKILLYFPGQDAFVTSGVYERYAFDSYYTVDMREIQISGDGENADQPLLVAEEIKADKSYRYGQEVLSLVVRMIVTILAEMAVAFLFGFRRREELYFLACVNVMTQVVLNVLLNIINYKSGYMAFVLGYVLLEIAVFVTEAVLYCRFLKKINKQPKRSGIYVGYALIANAVSFGAGFAIAKVIPGIF